MITKIKISVTITEENNKKSNNNNNNDNNTATQVTFKTVTISSRKH